MSRLSESLKAIRTIENGDQSQISAELENFAKNITNKIDQISDGLIYGEKDVDNVIQTGLLNELIGQTKRTPTHQLSTVRILPLFQICQKGTVEQTQRIYKSGILHALTPKLKNNNKNVQLFILLTFIYIIKNGWKQLKQSAQQSNLQEILKYQHPYVADLHKHGIIKRIIIEMLTNQNIDSQNKRLTCKFLDILYIEGLQLPSKLQDQVISGFNTLNSQDEMQQEGSFGALSYMSVNKENYDAIIEEGYLDDAIDIIRENDKKESRVSRDQLIAHISQKHLHQQQ
ncbi:MAG: hypothetical protein EZS28_042155 [Streblomastix strix]|uniref:Uncharacterized protein n=1 Tax=Streblomastix strix TaxID=222440 RepID=A0A5J4TVZ4_9EUKA|nr:MAG: hypothetical protein EZS28_042155 [Streblomastix strix]